MLGKRRGAVDIIERTNSKTFIVVSLWGQDHVVCGCADGSIYAFEIATFTPCLRIPANRCVPRPSTETIALSLFVCSSCFCWYNRISAPCTSIGVRSRVVIAAFSTGHLRFYRLFVDEVAVEVAAHARPITQLALHPRKPLVSGPWALVPGMVSLNRIS